MPRSLQLALLAAFLAATSYASSAQTAAPPQTKKPSNPANATPSSAPTGPAAPQSKHFPILLLAFGPAPGTPPATGIAATEPGWSIRIGQKGPERLDRPNYPPIMLEPVDVNREGTSETWTYRAKDSATAAEVTVRLTREPCTADATGTKYTFRAEAQHAQLGSFSGCAKIAAELFPEARARNSKTTPPTRRSRRSPLPPTSLNSRRR